MRTAREEPDPRFGLSVSTVGSIASDFLERKLERYVDMSGLIELAEVRGRMHVS